MESVLCSPELICMGSTGSPESTIHIVVPDHIVDGSELAQENWVFSVLNELVLVVRDITLLDGAMVDEERIPAPSRS